MALQQIPDRPDAGLEPSSRALVEKLDELLVDCTPKEIEDPIHGIEYMVGLEELKKASASNEKKIELAVSDKACQLLAESRDSKLSSKEPFRVLSVGCGDGTFDAVIIQAMISKYPEIKIDYTGVDIDEESCQKAMEELSMLKTKLNDNFTLRILTMDMNSLTLKGEIPPCDLALAMHALYYAKDIRKVITDVHTLLKADGYMFILLSTDKHPGMTHLFCRFWLHEHGWPINLSDAAEESLDALGIKYKKDVIDGEMDYTECFRDGFQKLHQKLLLDFMTNTRLERYPLEISQLCVEFLDSAAIGKPEQYIIPFSVAFIVCKSEQTFNS